MDKVNKIISDLMNKVSIAHEYDFEFCKAITVEESETIINYIDKLEKENEILKTQRNRWKKRSNKLAKKCDKYRIRINGLKVFIKDTCYYPDLENYSNMTSDEVKELMDRLEKIDK